MLWRAARFVLFLAAFILLAPAFARAASDPSLEWRTLETKHFRIHYERTLEPIAEHVASLAEGANERLENALGSQVSQTTEIVITDFDDVANGSATAIPYNAIRLHVSPPDDLSDLADYDNWYLALVTHENTHIVHTDQIGGMPALLNSIFGRRFVPNQIQPRWIIEGLAVMEESLLTGGGRNRGAMFDMYLRADVLDDRIVPLDEISNSTGQTTHRWPQGKIPYLYGSHFVEWIADVYGDDVWKAVPADYGSRSIPWSINRSIRRATGRTYEQLYPAWVSFLKRRYAAQISEAARHGGLREGQRLTHHGQIVASPRFIPRIAATSDDPELIYYRDDAKSRSGLYRLRMAQGEQAQEKVREELVARTWDRASAAFAPDGEMLYNSTAYTKRVYAYYDLFRLPVHGRDPDGYPADAERLTTGARAQDPEVSPDGRHIVFTKCHLGTTALVIAERGDHGEILSERPLVPAARFDQSFTPRFSPDGRLVAYSAWTEGGYRDIRIVDVGTGAYTEITHDRALDWQPVFSPDGRYVYFASDRAFGIPNIFAFDRERHEIWQVTNVRTGAFYPEISPDGMTLVYVGYTSFGFDLYEMPIDRNSWAMAPEYVNTRPPPPDSPQSVIVDRYPYNPLSTLRPRSYTLSYAPGTFGDAFTVAAQGADVVGHHSLEATLRVETDQSDPQPSLSYDYGRLPFDFSLSLQSSLAPVRYSDLPTVFVRRELRAASSVSYVLPSRFEANAFSLGYSLTRLDGGTRPLSLRDPDAPIASQQPEGQLGTVGLSWGYWNTEGYVSTVGSYARGFSLGASARVSARALGSDFSLYVIKLSASEFIPMPWSARHTLALRAAAGFSAGDYPNRSTFYLGGFADQPLMDLPPSNFTNLTGRYQDSFVVRGYAPLKFSGQQYQLYSAEYRFPLITVDRGVFPVFLSRMNGVAFADYGGAFDDFASDKWSSLLHLGVGGELWFEIVLFYSVSTFFRVGHATAVQDAQAIQGGQTYAVLAVPY